MHDELIKYELETGLLSKLLMHPELYYQNAEKLNVNMFDNMFHKRIYDQFLVMQSEQKDIDLLSMSNALGCNHEENIQLSNVFTFESQFISVKSAIDSLHELSRKKTMHTLITEAQNKYLNGESTDKIIAFINKMNAKMMVIQDSDVADIKLQMKEFLIDIDKRIASDGIIGVTTGYKSLDEFTGGWQGTDLVIIGAASSMGKTSLALNLAYNAVKHADAPALIFSYEMSVNQLIMRLVALESEIPIRWIQNGELKDEDIRRVQQTASDIIERKIYIDECKQTSLNYLISKTRQYVHSCGIKLVFVDYLQLVTASTGSKGTREQEVSKVARALKNLAKELNITIVALSQLNRGVGFRAESKPTLSDLRESGEIEQAADVVALVYRPEYYGINQDENGESTQGKAQIIFAKGRNIGVGTVTLNFISELTKFKENTLDF
jgi:replicative DNA helicase